MIIVWGNVLKFEIWDVAKEKSLTDRMEHEIFQQMVRLMLEFTYIGEGTVVGTTPPSVAEDRRTRGGRKVDFWKIKRNLFTWEKWR